MQSLAVHKLEYQIVLLVVTFAFDVVARATKVACCLVNLNGIRLSALKAQLRQFTNWLCRPILVVTLANSYKWKPAQFVTKHARFGVMSAAGWAGGRSL